MNLPSYLKKFSSKQLTIIRLLGIFIWGFAQTTLAQTHLHNLASLRQEAETHLSQVYQSDQNERLEIKLGYWDRRLTLSACQQPIAFSLQDSAGLGGNVTLNCQCQDSPGWMIHLPAKVDIYRSVTVAAQTIARGKQIKQADLKMETRNLSQISNESLIDSTLILGKAAKRTISPGDVIRPSLLEQPKTIVRGETVTITSGSGRIQVVMKGTAMSDGKLGQQIRIKNSQSERIISARVVGLAAVEIQ